jgi:hypothetical protein
MTAMMMRYLADAEIRIFDLSLLSVQTGEILWFDLVLYGRQSRPLMN